MVKDNLDRTGDWDGERTKLANKGVQFNVLVDQYIQDVANGGRNNTAQYGGHVDYLLNLDLMQMGVLPGALVKFRAESRYGNSVNSQAGPILPVNTAAAFPITDQIDAAVPITVTDLNGVVWFRKTFDLPKSAATVAAELQLGMIDDIDTAWVNGVKVGATAGYNLVRKYAVPPGVLKTGRNVIAVLVQHGCGNQVVERSCRILNHFSLALWRPAPPCNRSS